MTAVRCERCKALVNPGDVRYTNESNFECTKCHEERKGASQEKKEQFDVMPAAKEALRCESCGYVNKFKPDANVRKRCTYCGSEALSKRRSTAAELLASVDPE